MIALADCMHLHDCNRSLHASGCIAIRAVKQSVQQLCSMHAEHPQLFQLFGTAGMAAGKVDDVTHSLG